MKKSIKNNQATKTDIKLLKGDIEVIHKDMDQGFTLVQSQISILRDETKGESKSMSLTIDKIYAILDSEARFIKVMGAEHPLLVKRVERVEDKLGLPHTLLESK